MPNSPEELGELPEGMMVLMSKVATYASRIFGLVFISASHGGCQELSHLFGGDFRDPVVAKEEVGICTSVTPGQALQETKVCDRGDSWLLVTPDWQRFYGKKDLKAALNDLYSQFATNPRLGGKGLTGAGGEIWIDAALTDPSDVRFTLLFRVKGGMVVLRQPLDIALWTVDPALIGFVPEFEYPSRKARKTGVLQLVPHHDVTRDQVERILAESGLTQEKFTGLTVTGPWPLLRVNTGPLTEGAVLNAIFRHPRARLYIQDALFVPWAEREGAKVMLMRMTLDGVAHGL